MLASEVGKLLEGCSWVGIPFAGSMCEIPHIKARTVAVNDLHRHIINLARVVADDELRPMLVERLDQMPYHPDALRHAQISCRAREDGTISKDCPLWWAADYYVCAWMTRHGQAGTDGEFKAGLAIRWNAAGGDNVKHFLGGYAAFDEWQKHMRRCTFTTLDCFDFLAKCKDESGHGIYCDPPFPGPGDGYTHKFSPDRHARLAEVLGRYQKARVVCRFYEVERIRELYPEDRWTWHRFVGRKQTNAEAPEVLLVNRTQENLT